MQRVCGDTIFCQHAPVPAEPRELIPVLFPGVGQIVDSSKLPSSLFSLVMSENIDAVLTYNTCFISSPPTATACVCCEQATREEKLVDWNIDLG